MFVKQRAIKANHRSAGACPPRTPWDSQRIFTNERPVQLPRANFEECLEGGADSGFMGDTVLSIPVKGIVVGGYRFMGWFDVECWHKVKFSIFCRRIAREIWSRSRSRIYKIFKIEQDWQEEQDLQDLQEGQDFCEHLRGTGPRATA